MASHQISISLPLSFNIILLGKTGNGKSASGNTILGKNVFNSRKSFKTVTQKVQMESVTVDGVTLNVYDTPGNIDLVTINETTIEQYQAFSQLDESARTVCLWVIMADRSAFEVQQLTDLIPEHFLQNTWILFTKGDELERDNLTIDQLIEDSEEVKKFLHKFQNRYHIFNNFSQNPSQVTELINKIKQATEINTPEIGFPRTTPSESEMDIHCRRIMLVGKTGVGKSATGNTIFGENRFKSDSGASSITSECELVEAVVSGRSVSVTDTPGLFDTRTCHEEYSMEIGRSIYLSSLGPHVFLYVQPVNVRFTEQEENVFQKLELIYGRDMKKYTIILFTHGDSLEKSVEMVIKENRSLCRLVEECGGGYHIFNNKQPENREQVSELLEKIDRMVEKNGGTCYSNQMYEDAFTFRKEKEKRWRRCRQEETGSRRREKGKVGGENKEFLKSVGRATAIFSELYEHGFEGFYIKHGSYLRSTSCVAFGIKVMAVVAILGFVIFKNLYPESRSASGIEAGLAPRIASGIMSAFLLSKTKF